jgi:hypothetical protein
MRRSALTPDTTRATALSPTLQRLASMTRDEAYYWGREVYDAVGPRVYDVYKELTAIPVPLRAALKTVWTALWAADDISTRGWRGGQAQ